MPQTDPELRRAEPPQNPFPRHRGTHGPAEAASTSERADADWLSQNWRRADPWLYVPAILLILIGSLMVLNTTYFLSRAKTGDGFHYFKAQLAHIAVGAVIGALLSQFSLAGLRRLAAPLAIVSVAMLIAVWIPGLGLVRGGARRWVRLGPMLAEPSELLKLALVFFLADFLARREKRIQQLKTGVMPVIVIMLLLVAILVKQPDFGSAVIVVLLTFVMLLTAGAKLKHLTALGGAALAGLTLLAIAQPYRIKRVAAFLDPWRTAQGAGFQLIQSFIALGEGGEWGQGLGAGQQKMFYLPQAHTDFVFAVVTDDFGLVGALAVLGLFAVLLLRGMRMAHAEADSFGSLLGFGISSLFALQVLINIAVVIGLVPTKGLPLPFLSYGGSSIIMALAQLGVLLALSRRPILRTVPKLQYSVRQRPNQN
ncbi:MAG TPA: putative lipid II flippase FtsW [Candidatus Binataceae bacterium]|nr:putative lipid II flippase FtsW [Candidatus Binataceae bacterium]